MDSKRASQIEKEIAKALGFRRVSGSGSKWHNKEDISDELDIDNENSGIYLVQVKASETTAVKVELKAINILVSNAKKYHKKPLFCVHFDREDTKYPTWIAMPLQHFIKLKKRVDEC